MNTLPYAPNHVLKVPAVLLRTTAPLPIGVAELVVLGTTLVATLGVTAGAAPQIFNDPTPSPGGVPEGDRFGQSVALDGNNVLLGAPYDDTNGTDVGQAHLFEATTGNLLQTFNDPTPTIPI
ncbi:MAG: FG-GAP repeat protein, partial [Aeoliella sp.]